MTPWRIVLSIQAMVPLFFVMFLKYFIALCFSCEPSSLYIIVSLVFFVLTVLGICTACLFRIDAKYGANGNGPIKNESDVQIKVEGDKDDMLFAMLSTLVIPFISGKGESVDEILLVGVVILVVFIIIFICRLYYGNLVLGLFGYRSFEFRVDTQKDTEDESRELYIGIAKRETKLTGSVELRWQESFYVVS